MVELSAEARRALKALAAEGARIEGHRQYPAPWKYRVEPSGERVGLVTVMTLLRAAYMESAFPGTPPPTEHVVFRITDKGRGAL